ncbi:MAG: hypothetical protein GKS00_06150 [Alphaproteobacteria bacterium]|nr:hypothetical protein [Alphaproteobacteria bacterium]
MIVLRIIGRLLIILATITLLGGLVIWLFGADVTRPAGAAWYEAHVTSLNFSQVIVQRHLHIPAFWDSVIVPHLLARPVWEAVIIIFVVLLIMGGLFVRLGRQRHLRRSGLG